MTDAERLYQDNLQLGKIEYQLHQVHLRARPRALGLVLSNRCNLRCIHCYQVKNDDSLFAPAEIGRELRRELAGFYPYLSMLDLLGGEVFLSPGFEELVEDVAAMVSRPILNISTNGTLLRGLGGADRAYALPHGNGFYRCRYPRDLPPAAVWWRAGDGA